MSAAVSKLELADRVAGALWGMGARAIPDELKRGLKHSVEIEQEIARFVEARIGEAGSCGA